MVRPGIRDLVGRLMVDKDFLGALVRDPEGILDGYELDGEERRTLMRAIAQAQEAPERERVRTFQTFMLKRWAT